MPRVDMYSEDNQSYAQALQYMPLRKSIMRYGEHSRTFIFFVVAVDKKYAMVGM